MIGIEICSGRVEVGDARAGNFFEAGMQRVVGLLGPWIQTREPRGRAETKNYSQWLRYFLSGRRDLLPCHMSSTVEISAKFVGED
jgi:hypothetical protein